MILRKNSRILDHYKLLLDNTQEMLLFFDSHGKITDCNERAIKELGYGDDICQLPIHEIFKKAFYYQDKVLTLDQKYKNNPEETIAYRKNQTCFPVSLKVTISCGKRNIGCCSAINISEVKDAVSEVRNLKSELKNMEYYCTELIANATHELKTPINGILGFTNSLLSTQLTQAQLEDIDIIKRCCNNMNSIINNVLDYSKITNSNLELEKRDFNFREFIHQIIKVNSIRINEKGLKLLVDVSDEIPETVTGDELRLSQILNNLFSNALKFTPYGQIGLEVTKINQTEDTIELFFMMFDTGIGISAEEKDKLFKSFSQGDSSITRRFGGTGLGLSICKKLIEAMGGTIQVDSEKNVGSIFTFSVRLGLPQDSQGVSLSTYDEGKEDVIDRAIRQPEAEQTEHVNSVSEIEYIKMRLQNSNTDPIPKVYGREAVRDVLADINSVLEKLIICIEMENWSKAEELVTGIKRLVPQERVELSKVVFRLLLAVRKENHDSSLNILKELKAVMRKEE